MAGEATIQFTGNTTSEATLRFSPGGDPIASFTVAVTGRKKDGQSGRYVDKETTFYRCSVFGPMAEHVAATLDRSGIRVFVSGRFEARSYEKDGQTRMSMDVAVDSVGPELRFGEVKVPPKADRERVPAGGRQQPAADPWATGPSTAYDDSEPPF